MLPCRGDRIPPRAPASLSRGSVDRERGAAMAPRLPALCPVRSGRVAPRRTLDDRRVVAARSRRPSGRADALVGRPRFGAGSRRVAVVDRAILVPVVVHLIIRDGTLVLDTRDGSLPRAAR